MDNRFNSFINNLSISKEDKNILCKNLSEDTKFVLLDTLKCSKYGENGTLIDLPVKPYSYIWVASKIRYLGNNLSTPDNCINVYCETCDTCQYYNKECNSIYVPIEVWFHLDSQYVNLVLNEWGKTVFANKEECLDFCMTNSDTQLLEEYISKMEG